MKFKEFEKYVYSCPALAADFERNIDLVGSKPITYSIGFMPPIVLSEDIVGGQTIRERFTFNATLETGNNQLRLDATEQAYNLWKWINEQGKTGAFPDAAEQGETIQAISADNPVRLDFEGGNQIGLYQIQIYVDYHKEA